MDFFKNKNTIPDISPEKLLGRPPVRVDTGVLRGYISGKTVLVTGGGGSIGSELCRQLARLSPRCLVILDNYENGAYDLYHELRQDTSCSNIAVEIATIRDLPRLRCVFATYRPELVFHAAAHKHVPLMEHNPEEAVKNNVMGTQNVLQCAVEMGTQKFVLISTDKAVNPTSVMGATKRLCEMLVQEYDANCQTICTSVRFGNVLGSNGSVVPLFERQIASGGPVTVTDRQATRYFMTVPEAVGLVLQAGAIAQGGEVFALDMGAPVCIYDVAVRMIEMSGLRLNRDVSIVETGLRPGEKLHEEVCSVGEDFKQTSHQRIFCAKPKTNQNSAMGQQLEEMYIAAKIGDTDKMLRALTKLVPEYRRS